MNGKKTVAIVGFSPVTRMLAPWDDPDITIWGVNEEHSFDWFKRKEGNLEFFQLHQRNLATRKNNHNDPKHEAWLKEQHDFPIYMQEHWDDFPSSVKFPLDDIRAKFSNLLGCNYYTSTLALLLAFAAYRGFERVELYGFELGSEIGYADKYETEYGYQRPGAFYWSGVLRGLGIEVYVPPQSGFLQATNSYAYDDSTIVSFGCELDLKHKRLRDEHEDLIRQHNQMRGALVATQKTAERHPELAAEVSEYEKTVQNLMFKIKVREGLLNGLDMSKRLLHSVQYQNMEARSE